MTAIDTDPNDLRARMYPTNGGTVPTTTDLGTFDGLDVITSSVAITNAGDGLSQAMSPEFHASPPSTTVPS